MEEKKRIIFKEKILMGLMIRDIKTKIAIKMKKKKRLLHKNNIKLAIRIQLMNMKDILEK